MTTLEWLSKRLGQVEVIRETAGSSKSTTLSNGLSQSETESSGWSASNGASEGQSDMAELQSLAARDGGSGLVPFLARAGASGVGISTGRSSQDGLSGGASQQRGESSSSGTSDTTTQTESIHLAALMMPDEISTAFDRKTGRQIALLDSLPVVLLRASYDTLLR